MDHVAIDLGGRESQICIRSSTNEILREERVSTRGLKPFFASLPRSRIIMETCSEAFTVALQAKEAGHEVRVVPATVVRALGVGRRRIKTDQRDARCLSEASVRADLQSVHVPTDLAREMKTSCVMRDQLVGCRTALINSVRGWHRQELLTIPGGASGTFPSRVRTSLELVGRATPPYIERQLKGIEALTEQINGCDEELEELSNQNKEAQRLMTLPGVGPATSVRFLAAIDDIKRFKTAHELESYFGLTPGEQSSSDTKHRTGLTKAGSRAVRWLMIQAAWSALRTRPNDPMVLWARSIGHRKGKMAVAVVALARKMIGVMFGMLRDGTNYDPQRASTARSVEVPRKKESAAQILEMSRRAASKRESAKQEPSTKEPREEVKVQERPVRRRSAHTDV